jgi:ATP-dependent exoDNAse (exonuclease V) beta subunit
MPEKILTFLAEKHPHERDEAIQRETKTKSKTKTTRIDTKNTNNTDNNVNVGVDVDEYAPSETYQVWTIHGDAYYKGVTSYVASLFQEFDADAVIDKMMASPKWPQSPYYGMEKEEIKKLWEDKGKKAADDGTAMHYSIECFYNKEDLSSSSSDEAERRLLESEEYKQFLKFENDYCNVLKPYRSEWLVYHEEMKFKGIIDMVYENEDGSLSIYDWKRVKDLSKFNKWQSAKEPITHIPDSNYWHYCIQLNIYKRILEEKYEKTVKEMYLVCLYPGQDTYKRVKVIDMPDEIDTLFEKRASYLKYVEDKKREKEKESV